MRNSKEQWDYPNGWSPINHMIIEGLRKSDDPISQEWVRCNLKIKTKFVKKISPFDTEVD